MGDWKLVLNGGSAEGAALERGQNPTVATETVELFNLADDIAEKANLAATNTEKVKELRARYSVLAAQAVSPKLRPRPADFTVPKIWGEGQ